jgi:hypothetical protein
VFILRVLPGKTHFGAPTWFASKLGPGIFQAILQPPHYPLPRLLDTIARSGDAIALTAILLASLMAILLLRMHPLNPPAIAAALFVALVIVLTDPVYWVDINEYARVFSPLLLLVALGTMAGQGRVPWWAGLVPVILVDLRLSMEFASAAGGVVRGLLRQ